MLSGSLVGRADGEGGETLRRRATRYSGHHSVGARKKTGKGNAGGKKVTGGKLLRMRARESSHHRTGMPSVPSKPAMGG